MHTTLIEIFNDVEKQMPRRIQNKFHADGLMLLSLEKDFEFAGLSKHLIRLSLSQPYTFASLEMCEINMILN